MATARDKYYMTITISSDGLIHVRKGTDSGEVSDSLRWSPLDTFGPYPVSMFDVKLSSPTIGGDWEIVSVTGGTLGAWVQAVNLNLTVKLAWKNGVPTAAGTINAYANFTLSVRNRSDYTDNTSGSLVLQNQLKVTASAPVTIGNWQGMSLSNTNLGSAGQAYFNLNTDGTWLWSRNDGRADSSGNWHANPAAGIGSNFQVKIDTQTTTIGDVTGNITTTYANLGTRRYIRLYAPLPPAGEVDNFARVRWKITIYDTVNNKVYASGDLVLNCASKRQ